MGNKTKIDWADSTWNPVTGCLHGCRYCYARGITHRFGGASETDHNECVGSECQWCTDETGELHVLEDPFYDPDRGKVSPYPYYFDPTFHKYRLDNYKKKSGRNIFVVSMGDLFGKWVPDEWIDKVFKACEDAPQHNYLFLTKNPQKYSKLHESKLIPLKENFWFGSTVTGPDDEFAWFNDTQYHHFLSIEPLLKDFGHCQVPKNIFPEWVIIGAESGNKKGKVVPKREWIEEIVRQCREACVPVFMKESLRKLMGDDFIQEWPDQLKHSENEVRGI